MVALSVNSAALTAGTYATSVIVTGNAINSPVTIPVTLNVSTPPAVIGLSPTNFSFSANEGTGVTPAQQLTIRNNGGGNMFWSVARPAWVHVLPMSGVVPSGAYTVADVLADATGKAAGTYSSTLSISSPQASNSPQNFQVTLKVTPVPLITLSPTSLSFNAYQGQSNPPAQTVTITNTGTGTLEWTASVSDPSRFSVTPASGIGDGTATVTANIAGLAAGSCGGTLTIAATGAANTPQSVNLNLVVSVPDGIGVDPTFLALTWPHGGTSPVGQLILITNTGQGTISWTAASNQPWITMWPDSGTANPAPSSSALNVYLDPTGKAPGTYTGNVFITSPGAFNSPLAVPVILTIRNPITVTYPNGGETLKDGQSVVVTWDIGTQIIPAKTEALYSTDGGSTWKLIKSMAGTQQSCTWKVPGLSKASSRCLVKAQFKDSKGKVFAQDTSDAFFTTTK